jgi:hypothetical protein
MTTLYIQAIHDLALSALGFVSGFLIVRCPARQVKGK